MDDIAVLSIHEQWIRIGHNKPMRLLDWFCEGLESVRVTIGDIREGLESRLLDMVHGKRVMIDDDTKSMDINEPSLMDVTHDTINSTQEGKAWKATCLTIKFGEGRAFFVVIVGRSHEIYASRRNQTKVEHAHSSAVERLLNCEEHQLRSCGLLRSGRNCLNSMKESREVPPLAKPPLQANPFVWPALTQVRVLRSLKTHARLRVFSPVLQIELPKGVLAGTAQRDVGSIPAMPHPSRCLRHWEISDGYMDFMSPPYIT
ncbi:hypothetical protein RND71_038444 [Anisodus tanguticus]|uniref:Uncharacterized protein n=1 Tax=Anisodus tanguticus TaxID=243964 RepID=A0AAE1QZZ5_9SOLA|nr:hypothetical protein RND71_038444 [Anisodus tanguticus]